MTIKKLHAAAATFALGVGAMSGAYAASADFPGGIANAGTGIGDFMLSIGFSTGSNASINWDLNLPTSSVGSTDLNANDMRARGASPLGAFTVTSAAVGAFIAQQPLANVRWTGLALSNRNTGSDFGAIVTNNASEIDMSFVDTVQVLANTMNNARTWINANNTGGINSDATGGGTLVSTSTSQAWNFRSSSLRSGTRGAIAQSNGVNGLDTLVNLWFFSGTADTDFDDAASFVPEATLLGSLKLSMLEGNVAQLQFTPVPVPAAAWLFGSALAGMAALRRRKA